MDNVRWLLGRVGSCARFLYETAALSAVIALSALCIFLHPQPFSVQPNAPCTTAQSLCDALNKQDSSSRVRAGDFVGAPARSVRSAPTQLISEVQCGRDLASVIPGFWIAWFTLILIVRCVLGFWFLPLPTWWFRSRAESGETASGDFRS